MRIVSLVPSITELLFDLGCGENVAGRTKYCIHPREVEDVPVVGGTKNIDIQKILDLQPDWVIANREENSKNQIEALQKKANVVVTHPTNYETALQMIEDIAGLCQRKAEGEYLLAQIRAEFDKLAPKQYRKALYLIWRNPYMTVGKNTFISSMLQKSGFSNVAAGLEGNYPQITPEEMQALQPEYVLLSSEPYSFRDVHAQEILQVLPHAKILFVDGEMFSWYGSRMLLAASYFEKLLA